MHFQLKFSHSRDFQIFYPIFVVRHEILNKLKHDFRNSSRHVIFNQQKKSLNWRKGETRKASELLCLRNFATLLKRWKILDQIRSVILASRLLAWDWKKIEGFGKHLLSLWFITLERCYCGKSVHEDFSYIFFGESLRWRNLLMLVFLQRISKDVKVSTIRIVSECNGW